MKLVTSIAAATIVFAGAAAAQEADLSAGADVTTDLGVTAETGAELRADAAAEAGAEGGVEANYGQLISSLRNGKADVAAFTSEIASLDDDPEVRILTVEEIAGAPTPALDNALEKHEADLQSARRAIAGNEDLVAALEAAEVTADDVVAVEVHSSSDVTLIVDNRM